MKTIQVGFFEKNTIERSAADVVADAADDDSQ